MHPISYGAHRRSAASLASSAKMAQHLSRPPAASAFINSKPKRVAASLRHAHTRLLSAVPISNHFVIGQTGKRNWPPQRPTHRTAPASAVGLPRSAAALEALLGGLRKSTGAQLASSHNSIEAATADTSAELDGWTESAHAPSFSGGGGGGNKLLAETASQTLLSAGSLASLGLANQRLQQQSSGSLATTTQSSVAPLEQPTTVSASASYE